MTINVLYNPPIEKVRYSNYKQSQITAYRQTHFHQILIAPSLLYSCVGVYSCKHSIFDKLSWFVVLFTIRFIKHGEYSRFQQPKCPVQDEYVLVIGIIGERNRLSNTNVKEVINNAHIISYIYHINGGRPLYFSHRNNDRTLYIIKIVDIKHIEIG